MNSTAKDLFIIGLDPFNREKLASIRNAQRYNFHGVLDPAEVFDTYDFPIADMLERAEAQIREWQEENGRTVDGIVGYMDFPVSTMLPLLCEKFDAVAPSLESLLKCEHKYWSRLVQDEVIGDHIPRFRAFDPFEPDAFSKIDLELPFWIKPIKSSGSMLGFRILTKEHFDEAIAQIRDEIHLISGPFDFVLDQAELPAEVAEIGGHYCLAEGIIGGRQCTVEGYSWNGEVETFGIIDSIRYQNGSSFFRYEYPSTLPDLVREKMIELTETVIPHIGFDNSAFNIEYFWDRERNHVWLLEINTRVSMSHSDVFEKVDGQTNQQVSVQLACGEKPDFPKRDGEFNSAAKFFWRTFDGDAIVTAVPSEEEIAAVEERFPGTVVRPQVEVGMTLSELLEQDSYSYAICEIYVGGDDTKDLLDKFVTCQEMLTFEFEPIAA
ncbi:MAG: acetyl-CoA carboxylase biotin carboxylase subunit family protein [Actinomycetota bacterium]